MRALRARLPVCLCRVVAEYAPGVVFDSLRGALDADNAGAGHALRVVGEMLPPALSLAVLRGCAAAATDMARIWRAPGRGAGDLAMDWLRAALTVMSERGILVPNWGLPNLGAVRLLLGRSAPGSPRLAETIVEVLILLARLDARGSRDAEGTARAAMLSRALVRWRCDPRRVIVLSDAPFLTWPDPDSPPDKPCGLIGFVALTPADRLLVRCGSLMAQREEERRARADGRRVDGRRSRRAPRPRDFRRLM